MSTALAWVRRNWTAWVDGRTMAELRWLGVVLLVAFVLRLVWVIYAIREPQGLFDPTFYFGHALSFADGNGYRLPAAPSISEGYTAYYPVGYSAALSTVFALLKHTPIPNNYVLATGYLQVAVGLGSVAMIYEIGRRLFTPAIGLLAAFWLAVFPNLIFHTAAFLTETLFIFLMLAAVLALVAKDWREHPPGLARLGVFAVLLALSAYVRPISVLLIPLVLPTWLVAGLGWRRALRDMGLVTVVVAAAIAPWTVRNALQMDAFVIMSTNVGGNLCIGHHENAPGHFSLPMSCFPEETDADVDWAEFEVSRNNHGIKKAFEFAVKNPIAEVKLLSRKSYHLWKHDHDGLDAVESFGENRFIDDGLRTALSRTADSFFFFTISMGGIGLLGLVRDRDPRRLFFLLSLLAMAGIPLVFFGNPRFHVPVLPFLVVPAAWTFVTSFAWVRGRYFP